MPYILKQLFSALRFIGSYFMGDHSCFYFPIIVMIEPTNHCNVRCKMCIRSEISREKGFLSLKLFKELLNRNPEINRIVFCGSGEPLLHPELIEFIKLAVNRNIRTELNTNGVLLDKKISKELVSTGLHSLVVSFEGINRQEYEKIRLGSSYDLVVDNIINFAEAKKIYAKSKIWLGIDCIDFNYTRFQKRGFRYQSFLWGVDAVNFIPLHNWPCSNSKNNSYQNATIKNRYYGCFLPWLMVTILWDGRVTACCDDFNGENIIGELYSNPSILDIWNGEKMLGLREKLRKNNIDFLNCRNCHRIHKNPWIYPFANRIWREIKEVFL